MGNEGNGSEKGSPGFWLERQDVYVALPFTEIGKTSGGGEKAIESSILNISLQNL